MALYGWAYSTNEAKGLVGRRVALIDLREKAERDRAGTIPGSVHAPYADLQDNIDDGGLIHELAMTGKDDRLLLRFRRALGDGSAGRPGLATAPHIEGGMAAWLTAGDEAVEQVDIASEAETAWFDRCLAVYGPAKCKPGAHSIAYDAFARAARANYQAGAYAGSLPLD